MHQHSSTGSGALVRYEHFRSWHMKSASETVWCHHKSTNTYTYPYRCNEQVVPMVVTFAWTASPSSALDRQRLDGVLPWQCLKGLSGTTVRLKLMFIQAPNIEYDLWLMLASAYCLVQMWESTQNVGVLSSIFHPHGNGGRVPTCSPLLKIHILSKMVDDFAN